MISYKHYKEIDKCVNVRVINFNDECNGLGISLRTIANNGYNKFRLIKLNNEYNKEQCVAAIEDYIAVTNTERYNNDIYDMLKPEHILIVMTQPSGHQYALPFDYYKNNKRSMFSGIFIAGDSSMSDMLGHHYPIGVHNRLEY